MGHEACARAEDGQIAAPLLHLPELIVDNGLAQLVVADLQLAGLGSDRGILDPRDLPVAPVLKSPGRRGVVAVHIDDHVISLSVYGGGTGDAAGPTCSGKAAKHPHASPPVHFIFSSSEAGAGRNSITLARGPSPARDLVGAADRRRDGATRSSPGACSEATVALTSCSIASPASAPSDSPRDSRETRSGVTSV